MDLTSMQTHVLPLPIANSVNKWPTSKSLTIRDKKNRNQEVILNMVVIDALFCHLTSTKVAEYSASTAA